MTQPPVDKMVVVVHGTFASKALWWRWPSPFTQYLDSLSGGTVYKGTDFFTWRARDYDKDRRAGAKDLAAWVQMHPARDLTIVAHSHGGNVVMIATRHGVKMNRLILLGTPIRTDYTPDLRNVDVLHNVYSFGDLTQTPTGTAPHCRGEGRTLGDSAKVINHLAQNGFIGPGHTELHDVNVWTANHFDQLVS